MWSRKCSTEFEIVRENTQNQILYLNKLSMEFEYLKKIFSDIQISEI